MGNNFFQQDPEEVSFSIVYKNNESPPTHRPHP